MLEAAYAAAFKGVANNATLSGQLEGGCWREHAPAGTSMPYVSIGVQGDSDDDSQGSDGFRVALAFNLYTGWTPTAASDADPILRQIGTVFHKQAVTVTIAGSDWKCYFRRSNALYVAEPDFAHHHVLQFDVLIFPA